MTITQGADYLDLQTVKQQLNIDYNDDDQLIEAYIRLSLEYVRNQVNNTITNNTYEIVTFDNISKDEVFLPVRPNSGKIVLNTQQGVYWKIPSDTLQDAVNVQAGTANTPGGYVHFDNYKVDVMSLLVSFCEKHNLSLQDVKDEAAKGTMDIIFTTGMEDSYLLNLARMMIIGDWIHNREDSQYYTQNTINHGAKVMIDQLKGHQL